MRHHESERQQRDLAVQVVDDILAPGGGDKAEPRREAELQPHHGEAGIPDCDRELGPEIAQGRQWPDQEGKQRREHEHQIDGNPRPAAKGKAQLSRSGAAHCGESLQPVMARPGGLSPARIPSRPIRSRPPNLPSRIPRRAANYAAREQARCELSIGCPLGPDAGS
jgi:hypothetical protein